LDNFDVLIAHAAIDRASVEVLRDRLVSDGLRVCVIPSDDDFGDKVNLATLAAPIMILALSANATGSEWIRLEALTFSYRDAADNGKRFIPISLDNAELPQAIKSYAHLNWVNLSNDEYTLISVACTSALRGNSKENESEFAELPALMSQRAALPVVSVNVVAEAIIVTTVTGLIERWDKDFSARTVAKIDGERTNTVWAMSVSPDESSAVIGSLDGRLFVMSLPEMRIVKEIPMGKGFVAIYNLSQGELISILIAHDGPVYALALSADGTRFATSSRDGFIKEWGLENFELVRWYRISSMSPKDNTLSTRSLVYAAGNSRIISGSADGAIRVWNTSSGHLEATLEGHTRGVRSLVVHLERNLLLSASQDHKVKVWDWVNGRCLATLVGQKSSVMSAVFSRDGDFVYAGGRDRDLNSWDISACLEDRQVAEYRNAVRYTNAKVLLVGDSGVGKTGLAYRLASNEFSPSISTDGVWATQLKIENTSVGQIEREVWLWDFAGQADYRLIHQLYMDETAAAVLVFNPQSDSALDGLSQWDRDIERAARRRFNKLLVAGRTDRGGLTISKSVIDEFRVSRGFAGYFETSALTGTGCDELREAVVASIDWEDTPWTSSPRVFKVLKSEILALRDAGIILLRLSELKQQIEIRLPDEKFSIEQLRAVIGLLAGPGIVWSLEFGDFILLQPERVNSYAAAVIRSVRNHAEEIGCIDEDAVLSGRLDFQDMERVPSPEEQIILRAMHQTFVDHGLCIREHTENGTVLVFPSYFKRERPELIGQPAVLVTYSFVGQIDEIYATLVVKLHHTSLVERDKLWRFAADFRSSTGMRLGVRVRRTNEGGAELDVYFQPTISLDTQVSFIRYIHEHLSAKAENVIRTRHYICPHCHEPIQNRRAVELRLSRGLQDILCSVCESRVGLWDAIEEKYASDETRSRVRDLEELASAAIDNESRELILEGHARAITGEAGQIYRGYTNSDHGIDGEIEFKNESGDASGQRYYLQLKSGDSYLYIRKRDGAEVFTIKKARWAEYWVAQAYPVMLVIRTSDGLIRWMNVTEYLKTNVENGALPSQVIFKGEELSAVNVRRARQRYLAQTKI
jgi:small GTP-binding protein